MLQNSYFFKSISQKLSSFIQFKASISSLKVVWRKDPNLDEAIENDKQWRLCARVVREVLNEPGQVICVKYLEKRRKRMGLNLSINVFLSRNPGLFDVYSGRIRPKSNLVPFIRPSERVSRYLEMRDLVYRKNEGLIVSKLCKLLMMSRDNVVSSDKLLEVKREFGFPDDFLVNLVPRYPGCFRLVGCPGEGQSYLELVEWNDECAKSVIELRAEEESRKMGVRVRPAFNWKLPPGFFYRKEMREWVRDWMELPYISPYEDASKLDPASGEAEKRMVGVFHELLSLSLYKRITIDVLGKFCEDYSYSNAFSNAFTRHSGLFYVSLKGGVRTAMLREAYKGNELIDRDPLLEINEKFIELLAEGHKQWAENSKLQREMIQKDMESMAMKKTELDLDDNEEC
ncbi:hypothetical protein LIER_35712 [Lithospermum erythrorhizon]|uniref:PORR domain-containing protein n=1 Tax=Lithospermum erythrorhizon TaxID=34254 RepID=A0AAV3NZV7_LITER